MKLPPIKVLASNIAKDVSKHSPELLAGAAVCGVISTAILAVRATPKAVQMLKEKGINRPKKITARYIWEVTKTTGKCYIPTVISGGLTIAAIIASNRVSSKRAAVLASLYSVSEKALTEYQTKTEEIVGKNKAQKIHDEIMIDKVNENPFTNPEELPGNGKTICYDVMSGRYFWSDIETLRRIQSDLNLTMADHITVSLNDLYYELGLEPTKLGNDMGWNVKKSLSFKFTSKLTEDGRPVLVLDYSVDPSFFYPNDELPF